jgi:ParB family chromosome partitioning protein
MLAQKVGKERATVANVLRLLQLGPSVRRMVSEGRLSLGQAKVLLSLPDLKAQETMAQKAASESLSVRALEKLVARAKAPVTEASTSPAQSLREISADNLRDELQKRLGSKVQLDYKDGQGKIMIHFYSDQELNALADKLRKSWHN